MHRRALLATTAGSIAALTGCFGAGPGGRESPNSSPAQSPTDSSGTTPTVDKTPTGSPAPDPDVSVGSVVLQHGYVMPASPDSIGVTDGEQAYLVAELAVDGSLARQDVVLEVSDQSYTPETDQRFYRTEWGSETYYEDGRDRGLVVFAPGIAGDGADVRIAWPGGEYPIEGELCRRLGRPAPTMSAALALPAAHTGDDPPAVEIEVENESDSAARFLGALNRVGPRIAYAPVARVSGVVAAGGTRTLTVEDSWMDGPAGDREADGDPDVTYHLDYAGGEDSADIDLVAG